MDVQLEELVEKIRKNGVESAEAKAAVITQNAEKKAAAIIESAKREAEELRKKGIEEASRAETAAVSAIKQAARNLLIAFRDGITAELDALVKIETAKAFDVSVLRELVPAAVRAWIANSKTDDLAVLLAPSDAAKLESAFATALKAELSKGMEIRADASLPSGFRIGTKDGAFYYDFSSDSVAELFSAYLNPRVAEILKSAAKEM